MPLDKLLSFTKKVQDLADKPNASMSALQVKAQFDAAPDELRLAFNQLIDDLSSIVVGDSGAKNLGVSPISGVIGANAQAVLEDLKLQINGAVTGSIPDGSITQAKLAFAIATDAASVSIADAGNHFTSTKVEGALDELFTSANSVKTNVSGAIGSPATVNDTGSQLAGYITTEKGRIASEVGDGASSDTLKYLTDRLVVRSDAIATAVNAKGIPSTSADTLAQLATKVTLIPTGKKYASGTATSGAGQSFQYAVNTTNVNQFALTVTGLDFMPDYIYAYFVSGTTLYSTVYEEISAAGYAYPKTMRRNFTGNTTGTGDFFIFKGDVGAAVVNATGFVIPTHANGALYTWFAIKK